MTFQPEWYFTQILGWIRDHMDFMEQRIQPLLIEAGKTSIDAKVCPVFSAHITSKAQDDLLSSNFVPHLVSFLHQPKQIHLCSHWVSFYQISYGASLGQGNKSLFKWPYFFGQDGDQEVAGSTPTEVGNILSWRLIMKYFLRSFSPFRWFKKGSCQFLAKECAQYWLTA